MIHNGRLAVMTSSGIDEKSLRRARIAWCVYDWANSAFPTVIVTFVFSVYFVDGVAVDKITGTKQWAYALSLSGLRLRFSARFSVRSPTPRARENLARFFSAMTIVCAGLLWFSYPDPSFAIYALVVFSIANISFEVSQVFYNAMLPTIVLNDKIGQLSGWGGTWLYRRPSLSGSVADRFCAGETAAARSRYWPV